MKIYLKGHNEMYKLTLSLVVLVFSVIVTGCATNSVVASAQETAFLEKVSKMEIGKTTYNEVVGELGPPEKMANTPDGIKHRFFIVMSGSPSSATYVPVVGLFAGEVNYRGASANMTFNQQDVLLSKEVKKF